MRVLVGVRELLGGVCDLLARLAVGELVDVLLGVEVLDGVRDPLVDSVGLVEGGGQTTWMPTSLPCGGIEMHCPLVRLIGGPHVVAAHVLAHTNAVTGSCEFTLPTPPQYT